MRQILDVIWQNEQIKMIKYICFLVVYMAALAAYGNSAPLTSPVPKLRIDRHTGVVSVSKVRITRSLIPRLRQSVKGRLNRQNKEEISTLVQIAEHERQENVFRTRRLNQSGAQYVRVSLIPKLRPKKRLQPQRRSTVTAHTSTSHSGTKRYKRKGSVCGVRSIRGTSVNPVRGKGRCGIPNPVKLTEVSGVKLTRPVTVNCTTAKQLNTWIAKSAIPIVGRQGGGLSAIQSVAGYSCRTRNHRKGAKLSEHSFGNAIDIAGFVLKNGTVYSVKQNWRSGQGGKTLRRLHKSACGPFGTVLGPNSDRHHQDHFHLDVARHRNGAYCR